MNNKETKKRGDIYFYDFGQNAGSVQCGYRPVLILQADNFNRKAPTILVAAITSAVRKQYMPSHVMLPDYVGLDKQSMVMLEQIRAVNKDELTEFVGTVKDGETWRQLNNGMKKAFGLWHHRSENMGEVRCLCPRCAADYRMDPFLVVKRLDPFASVKEGCMKCEGLGYDYMIYDKRQKTGGKKNGR